MADVADVTDAVVSGAVAVGGGGAVGMGGGVGVAVFGVSVSGGCVCGVGVVDVVAVVVNLGVFGVTGAVGGAVDVAFRMAHSIDRRRRISRHPNFLQPLTHTANFVAMRRTELLFTESYTTMIKNTATDHHPRTLLPPSRPSRCKMGSSRHFIVCSSNTLDRAKATNASSPPDSK